MRTLPKKSNISAITIISIVLFFTKSNYMKRKLLNLLFVVTAVAVTMSCSDDDDPKISLHTNAITLFPGQDSLVSVSGSKDKSITWSSDKTDIATVDANGNIIAVAPGTANITAKVKGGNTASILVTVMNGYSYGGEVRESKTALFKDYLGEETEGWGMRFFFIPTTEEIPGWGDANEVLHIDIPTEMLGDKFELTEEDLYAWGWWIRYSIEDQDLFLEGFGSEGQMEDVVSGFMYAKQTGENTFDVQVDLVFTNGKKLVLGHKGAMTPFVDNEYFKEDIGRIGKKSLRN